MKALYARISDDAEGSGLGVLRQLKDCRSLAELREWQHKEYVDNDVSAYQRRVKRPQFEAMLRDLAGGTVTGVVVYNLDRLARQSTDLERLISIYQDHPEYTFATLEGDINLGTSDGLTMARVMVAFANKSSQDTGRRTKRKHLELAESGEPVGRRMFGWMKDLRSLDPTESIHARRVVDDLLAGMGMRELVRSLNDEGVKTTTGKEWSHQSLRNYLRNPRLMGVRTHLGKRVYEASGEPIQGQWEPLLDKDTYDRVQLVLDGHSGRSGGARRGARKYMLTGLLRCGICNNLLFGSKAREDGRFNYVCNTGTGERHTLSISGGPTDELLSDLTLRYLMREALEAKGAERAWPGEARLAEVDRQIKSLMDAFLAGTLSERVVFPRVEALELDRAEMQNSRTQWLVETTGPAVRRETPETWKAKTPDEKRAVMDKVMDAVYIRPPATRRLAVFDPERVAPPVWRAAPLSLLAADEPSVAL